MRAELNRTTRDICVEIATYGECDEDPPPPPSPPPTPPRPPPYIGFGDADPFGIGEGAGGGFNAGGEGTNGGAGGGFAGGRERAGAGEGGAGEGGAGGEPCPPCEEEPYREPDELPPCGCKATRGGKLGKWDVVPSLQEEPIILPNAKPLMAGAAWAVPSAQEMGLPDSAASGGVQQFEQELAIPPSHEFEVFHPGRPLEDEDAAAPLQEYAVFGDDGEQQQAQARQPGGASGEPLDYRVVSQPPDGFLNLLASAGAQPAARAGSDAWETEAQMLAAAAATRRALAEARRDTRTRPCPVERLGEARQLLDGILRWTRNSAG